MKLSILVSNDDGYNSEGIRALSKSMKDLGNVYLVAPDRDQSASSHSLNLQRPLRVEKIADNSYSVDGTPTDCINLAVNGLLNNLKPDIVVSGINIGANMGDDITYSGTVSAAIEGTLLGIPSIAISIAAKNSLFLETATYFSKIITRYVLDHGIPEGTLLNINIPNIKIEEVKGIKVTKQGKRLYKEPIVENVDPRGKRYYWIGGNELDYLRIDNSDIVSVKEGYVSVTPIKLDLTDYNYLKKLCNDMNSLNND